MAMMTTEDLLAVLSTEERELLMKRAENAHREAVLKKHRYRIYESGGKWYTCIPTTGRRARQICRATRDGLIDAIVSYYDRETSARTIAEVYEEAQARKAEDGSHAEATVVRNQTDFKRFYGSWKRRRIQDISAQELEDHLRQQVIDEKLTSNGWANLVSITRLIFRYAKKKKLTDLNVDDIIAGIDIGRKSFERAEEERGERLDFFTDEELRRIAGAIKREPTLKRLGLLLVAATGLRIGELAVLTWSDYDPEFRALSIHRTETLCTEVKKSAKTRAGMRRVYIPEAGAWVIDEIRELSLANDDDFIFFEIDHRKPSNPPHRIRGEYFRKELYRICDEVRIPRRGCHAFRKTYASILLDESIPEKYIVESLGHTGIGITNTFYARERLQAAQKQEVIDGVRAFDVIAKEQ